MHRGHLGSEKIFTEKRIGGEIFDLVERHKKAFAVYFAGVANEASRTANNRRDYHGGPDIRKALHLDKEGESYDGKRILIAGDRPQWELAEDLRAQGASVRTVPLEQEGSPFKRLTPKDFKNQTYDQVLFAMTLAFRSDKPKALNRLLKSAIGAVDFENGGEMSAVSLDFTDVKKFTAESNDPTVQRLLSIMSSFFAVAEFDMHSGRKIGAAMKKAAQGRPDLEVVESPINNRKAGTGWWGEIRDLGDIVMHSVDSALADLRQAPKFVQENVPPVRDKIRGFIAVKAEMSSFIEEVDEILKLPESERPRIQMPTIHTHTLRKK